MSGRPKLSRSYLLNPFGLKSDFWYTYRYSVGASGTFFYVMSGLVLDIDLNFELPGLIRPVDADAFIDLTVEPDSEIEDDPSVISDLCSDVSDLISDIDVDEQQPQPVYSRSQTAQAEAGRERVDEGVDERLDERLDPDSTLHPQPDHMADLDDQEQFDDNNQDQQRTDFHEETDADEGGQQDVAPADVQLQTVTVSRTRKLGEAAKSGSLSSSDSDSSAATTLSEARALLDPHVRRKQSSYYIHMNGQIVAKSGRGKDVVAAFLARLHSGGRRVRDLVANLV